MLPPSREIAEMLDTKPGSLEFGPILFCSMKRLP
jgi:hypothetical protein